MINEGHEIGNHGLKDSPMNEMSGADFKAAVLEWEKHIRTIVTWPAAGQSQKWFRPPSGAMSSDMASVLEELGYETAVGDVYSDDAHIDNAEFHSNIIAGSTCDGSIIILHVPDRAARLQTLQVVSSVLPRLIERGFKVTTLSSMFADEEGSAGPCNIGILLRALLVIAVCSPFAICCATCCKAGLKQSKSQKEQPAVESATSEAKPIEDERSLASSGAPSPVSTVGAQGAVVIGHTWPHP